MCTCICNINLDSFEPAEEKMELYHHCYLNITVTVLNLIKINSVNIPSVDVVNIGLSTTDTSLRDWS